MYDVALVDDDGKELTVADEPGHIVVKLDKWRSIGLFTEYIGNPEKMAGVFRDNYYYTGDRASIDEDGYWWFVGRSDDVIKSSDFRIGPFEVESAILEHPAVAESAIVGVPDEKRHQLVKAFIILKQNQATVKRTRPGNIPAHNKNPGQIQDSKNHRVCPTGTENTER